MTRSTFVYRLDVRWQYGAPRATCPTGTNCESCDMFDYSGDVPAVRNYLSRRAASRRADLLRHLGAEVEVQRSLPVEFDEALSPVVAAGMVDDGDD